MADLGILCQLDERRAPSDKDNDNDADEEKDKNKNPTAINQNSAVVGISTRRKSETQRPETSLRNQNQNDRGMDTAQMSDEESLSPVTPCFSADSPMPHTKTFVGYVPSIRVRLSHLICSPLFLTIVMYQFAYASIYPFIYSFRKAYQSISVSVALSLSLSLSLSHSLSLSKSISISLCYSFSHGLNSDNLFVLQHGNVHVSRKNRRKRIFLSI